MTSRLEAPHRSLTLTCWLVRVFCSIIQPFVLPVLDAHQDLPLGCAVAGKFVGDDHTWHVLAALEELAKESLRRRLIPPALDQDI